MPVAVSTDGSCNNNTMTSLEAIHLVESKSGKFKLENQVQEGTVGTISGRKYVIREDARKFWTSGSKNEGVFGTISSVDGVEQEKGVFEPMQGSKGQGSRATEVKIQEKVLPSGLVSSGNGKVICQGCGQSIMPRLFRDNDRHENLSYASVCPLCHSRQITNAEK